ncbi:hypothetical protein Rsub_12584 [Raphidocelis subcapitata]|uniref:RRM domain-containing protein n=1 Tax=Raphidocelis subcapitata TaxID=307507 RepID=A0A2V0PQ75_9CHLO|nr:hypothetical protein Rsub_12584 [Raphidocelis subcapitata]|eukprot:GBF99647.1 hypothetical protein Rsub_12584 [Raphidocelis subcapitata]
MRRVFSAVLNNFNMRLTASSAAATARATTLVASRAGLVAPRPALGARAGLPTTASAFYAPAFAYAPRMTVCAAAAQEETTAGAQQESNQIFVNNLPWSADDDSLGRYVSAEVGGLTGVRVLMRDGRSTGRAIVDFESPEAAQAAVQRLDQTDLDGRTLGVRIAEPRPPRGDRPPRRDGDRPPRRDDDRPPRRDGERPPPRDPETLLYVGNLAWSLSWQDVKDAFSDAGLPVVFASVKTTPEGRSRGFAIVAMADAEAAARAVEEMDQREIAGRPINVRRFNTEPRE